MGPVGSKKPSNRGPIDESLYVWAEGFKLPRAKTITSCTGPSPLSPLSPFTRVRLGVALGVYLLFDIGMVVIQYSEWPIYYGNIVKPFKGWMGVGVTLVGAWSVRVTLKRLGRRGTCEGLVGWNWDSNFLQFFSRTVSS